MTNIDTALGWMAVATFEHLPREEDPDDPLGGCCTVNCGPCSALHSLDEPGRRELERIVMLTGYHQGGWDYWNDETSQLQWSLVEAVWAQHKSCGTSNGVLTGCNFDEEDGT